MKILFIALLSIAFASSAQQKVSVKYNDPRRALQTDTPYYKSDVTLLNSSSVTQLKDTSKAIHLRPEQLVWKDALPPLPPGAKVAFLEGSPREKGLFTIRLKLPPHWMLPAHWHPAEERVTVLSGSLYVGFGDKLDTSKGIKYSAGSFYVNPAGSHHYVYTGDSEVLLQITGQGPWGLTYIEEKK